MVAGVDLFLWNMTADTLCLADTEIDPYETVVYASRFYPQICLVYFVVSDLQW